MAEIINFKTFEDLDLASLASDKEVRVTGLAKSFPVSIFHQGKRDMISAVFPISFIVKELESKPVKKGTGVVDARGSMNRPLDEKHASTTKDYIKKNFKSKYILPSMTLNIQEPVNVYTTDYKSPIKQGYMVVPYGVKLSITDGQHRRRALADLVNEISSEDFDLIKNDGICVMITVENDINQIHQDFADCSKSKELPKSLIAVYDKRNPANGIVIDLLNGCPVFKDKVDASSNTLSKKSTKLFLVSQVRSAIKELLLASSAAADIELEKRTIEIYGTSDSDAYQRDVPKFIDFINKVVDNVPILKEVSKLSGGGTIKIPAFRSEYLILNSAGLNIVCRIGHELIFSNYTEDEKDEFIKALSKIDWKKTAAIWRDNIVQQGAAGLKISTANSTIKEAVKAVKQVIGLPIKDKV